MKIFITGGSGYLGLFLVKKLSDAHHDVAFSYHSRALNAEELRLVGNPKAFRIDLTSGAGFDAVSEEFGYPEVVINCAAVSSPRKCEEEKEVAATTNVPTALLTWMKGLHPPAAPAPLLIHLSTDQVYEGTKAYNKEEDERKPVNTYGRTKLGAENLIRSTWPNYAILRSSIIVGPQPVVDLPRTLPLLWMDKVLSQGEATDFFCDEFRNPVYVHDVVDMVCNLLVLSTQGTMQHVLNAGGPQRLSRAHMARLVALGRGYDVALVKSVPAAYMSGRGVVSPLDISMDTSRIQDTLGVHLTSFEDVVKLSF